LWSLKIDSIIIRPIEDQDYEPASALVKSIVPELGASATAWRQADAHADQQHRTMRYVAVDLTTQQVVAYGWFWWVRLQKYRLDLIVAPAWRRRGIGGRLLQSMLDDTARRGAATVQARTDEEDLETLTFLWRYGFVETQRMYRLVLDVATANLTTWRGLEPQLVMQGISISTFAYERAHDPSAFHKLYNLHVAALPDWPDPDPDPNPPTTIAFADYFRRFEQGAIVPEGFFIAKRGDRYVGYSGLLEVAETPGRLYSAGTIVHPATRRLGVATVLKVHTIAYAQQHHCPILVANTASMPMLALNLRLGFRRERADVRLVRIVSA
jgi:GNAT superfamily N-acetyltransferase